MSRLILVRHSQASFFADNYDRLSPLGEQQARALGEHWVKLGIGFDEVIVGPRERQIETEQIVRSVYEANGRPWPRPKSAPNSTSTAWTSFWDNHSRSFCGTIRNSSRWPPTIATPRFRSRSSGVFSVCLRRFATCGALRTGNRIDRILEHAFKLASSQGCDACLKSPAGIARLECSPPSGISRSHSASCWVARRPRRSN